jgi:ribonuclease BN (tRNA processing enzyme)
VKITLLPSTWPAGAAGHSQPATSYLVNDTLAVDAGCLGLYGSWRDQARVRHVLLTHTHMDHVASLPLFLDNVYQPGEDPVTVHGSEAVLSSLRSDLFNNRVWPDFFNRSAGSSPYLRTERIEDGKPFAVAGLRVTPCAVNHVVPTLGFLLEEDRSAVLIVSDTGPTEAIWEVANQAPHLQAVFLEASFPDALSWLAEVSKHLTPASFARQAARLARPVRLIAVHIKPRYEAEVVAELKALGLPGLEIASFGEPYCF